MARIKWIQHRLDNWALWKVRSASGGLGFSTQAAFLAIKVDGSRDSPLPIDEIDAEKMDRAVGSLMPDKSHLHRTIELYYLKGKSIMGVAQEMARAESTVKANLAASDQALKSWFDAQEEAAQRAHGGTRIQPKAPMRLPGGLLKRVKKVEAE